MEFKSLNELAELCRQEAHNNGWDLKDLQVGTQLMLVNTELCEAIKADRYNKHCTTTRSLFGNKLIPELFISDVKDTFEDEIADAFIRLLHTAAENHVDLDEHVKMKLLYNRIRAYDKKPNY